MAELKVNERTKTMLAQVTLRRRSKDLMGGSDVVCSVERAKLYLPARPAESADAWTVRVKNTWLFDAYGQTIRDLTTRPFRKPLVASEQLKPEFIKPLMNDATLTGQSLTEFAHQVFEEAVRDGVTYIMPDFPQLAEGRTAEDDLTDKPRSYLRHITADDVLGFRTQRAPGGQTRLVQLRVRECTIEPHGQWDEKEVERVRVWTWTNGVISWALWEKAESGNEWAQVDTATVRGITEIPCVAVHTKRLGFMLGEPPLNRMGEKAIELLQNESMQVNSLDYARSVIYFGKAFHSDEVSKSIKLGKDQMIYSMSKDADFKVVEHTGAAIEAGRQRGLDIKEELVILGMKPLLERASNETATGRKMDDDRHISVAEEWVRNLETALTTALRFCAQFEGVTIPEEPRLITISDDFAMPIDSTNADRLIKLIESGVVDRQTAIEEAKRYSILAPSVQALEIIRRKKKEAQEELNAMVSQETETAAGVAEATAKFARAKA
jgi:hypothetical protein